MMIDILLYMLTLFILICVLYTRYALHICFTHEALSRPFAKPNKRTDYSKV